MEKEEAIEKFNEWMYNRLIDYEVEGMPEAASAVRCILRKWIELGLGK